jgi:hypothetical protein
MLTAVWKAFLVSKPFTGDHPMPVSIFVSFLLGACGVTMAASCHACCAGRGG